MSRIVHNASREDIDTRKKDVKKIRQANSPTTNFAVTSVTSTFAQRQPLAGGCKQIRAAHRGSKKAISINFYARRTRECMDKGGTRGRVIGCEYE